MQAKQSSCDIPLPAIVESALVRASWIGGWSSAIAEARWREHTRASDFPVQVFGHITCKTL
jgi:hypothetical protein